MCCEMWIGTKRARRMRYRRLNAGEIKPSYRAKPSRATHGKMVSKALTPTFDKQLRPSTALGHAVAAFRPSREQFDLVMDNARATTLAIHEQLAVKDHHDVSRQQRKAYRTQKARLQHSLLGSVTYKRKPVPSEADEDSDTDEHDDENASVHSSRSDSRLSSDLSSSRSTRSHDTYSNHLNHSYTTPTKQKPRKHNKYVSRSAMKLSNPNPRLKQPHSHSHKQARPTTQDTKQRKTKTREVVTRHQGYQAPSPVRRARHARNRLSSKGGLSRLKASRSLPILHIQESPEAYSLWSKPVLEEKNRLAAEAESVAKALARTLHVKRRVPIVSEKSMLQEYAKLGGPVRSSYSKEEYLPGQSPTRLYEPPSRPWTSASISKSGGKSRKKLSNSQLGSGGEEHAQEFQNRSPRAETHRSVSISVPASHNGSPTHTRHGSPTNKSPVNKTPHGVDRLTVHQN